VDDVELGAARVTELGGEIVMGPFDASDAGRMAIAADPTGAAFALWEPRNHSGAGLVNVRGALTWNDLGTRDVAAAKTFYVELFGWEMEDPDPAVPYTMIKNAGTENGSIHLESDGTPPSWLAYFAVDAVDESLATVGDTGGSILVSPTPVPAGRIAVLTDPQGAAFGVFEGDLDP
jgi:predicted enzyme related to lactoylglutathione lyase